MNTKKLNAIWAIGRWIDKLLSVRIPMDAVSGVRRR